MSLKLACPAQPQCPAPSVLCAQGDDVASSCCDSGALRNIDDLRDVSGGPPAQRRVVTVTSEPRACGDLCRCGEVAAAASDLNLRAATYDGNRIPSSIEATEDITTQHGFWTSVSLVMRLVPAGLLWLAPVCSSWGYMNASRCKREASNGYEGEPSYAEVAAGNAMAKATVFLM